MNRDAGAGIPGLKFIRPIPIADLQVSTGGCIFNLEGGPDPRNMSMRPKMGFGQEDGPDLQSLTKMKIILEGGAEIQITITMETVLMSLT